MRIKKVNEKLGRSVQRARKSLGYTQEELAEKVGISRTHMGHIEQGRKAPSYELLKRIATALKMKGKDLIPF